MNFLSFIFFITMIGCNNVPDRSNSTRDSSVVFAGTTPCSNFIRPINKIQPEPDCSMAECKCILVEWKLTLYLVAQTKTPAGYKLESVNRYIVKETNMYSEPGTKTGSEGEWAIIKGTKTDPNAIVYQLNQHQTEMKLSLLKLSDNLLHILDPDEKLMIGNEFHSYTLNRIRK